MSSLFDKILSVQSKDWPSFTDIINKYCKYVIENNSKKDLLRIGWKMSLRNLYKTINNINSRLKNPLNFFKQWDKF